MSTEMTRGVLLVHSVPRALCRHVEWALEKVLPAAGSMDWTEQPASPGMLRGEMPWHGEPGTGARLTSALRGWAHLRYEVTEEASPAIDGARWSHTPELGIFHAQTDAAGNIVVPEDRLRAAFDLLGPEHSLVRDQLALALGIAWDEELEPFRHAGDGAPVRWLHRVG